MNYYWIEVQHEDGSWMKWNPKTEAEGNPIPHDEGYFDTEERIKDYMNSLGGVAEFAKRNRLEYVRVMHIRKAIDVLYGPIEGAKKGY